jgi:putative Mn2+ efflux pump MntP
MLALVLVAVSLGLSNFAAAVGIGSALVGPADQPVNIAAVRERAGVIAAQVAELRRGASA